MCASVQQNTKLTNFVKKSNVVFLWSNDGFWWVVRVILVVALGLLTLDGAGDLRIVVLLEKK